MNSILRLLCFSGVILSAYGDGYSYLPPRQPFAYPTTKVEVRDETVICQEVSTTETPIPVKPERIFERVPFIPEDHKRRDEEMKELIREQKTQIEDHGRTIDDRDRTIREQRETIADREREVDDKNRKIAENEGTIEDQRNKIDDHVRTIDDRDREIRELRETVTERERDITNRDKRIAEYEETIEFLVEELRRLRGAPNLGVVLGDRIIEFINMEKVNLADKKEREGDLEIRRRTQTTRLTSGGDGGGGRGTSGGSTFRESSRFSSSSSRTSGSSGLSGSGGFSTSSGIDDENELGGGRGGSSRVPTSSFQSTSRRTGVFGNEDQLSGSLDAGLPSATVEEPILSRPASEYGPPRNSFQESRKVERVITTKSSGRTTTGKPRFNRNAAPPTPVVSRLLPQQKSPPRQNSALKQQSPPRQSHPQPKSGGQHSAPRHQSPPRQQSSPLQSRNNAKRDVPDRPNKLIRTTGYRSYLILP